LWVWQVQRLLFLYFIRSALLHARIVLDEDIAAADWHLFSWTLSRSLVVAERRPRVLSHTRCWCANSVVILRVKSTSNSALVHLISWILNWTWWLIDHILLVLSTVLVFHWNWLHGLLLISIHIIELIRVYLRVLMLILSRRNHLMASCSWTSTWILRMVWRFCVGTHWNSVASLTFIFFFHLIIQGLSIMKNLHKFFINFITI